MDIINERIKKPYKDVSFDDYKRLQVRIKCNRKVHGDTRHFSHFTSGGDNDGNYETMYDIYKNGENRQKPTQIRLSRSKFDQLVESREILLKHVSDRSAELHFIEEMKTNQWTS